jgi:hypothetical protein
MGNDGYKPQRASVRFLQLELGSIKFWLRPKAALSYDGLWGVDEEKPNIKSRIQNNHQSHWDSGPPRLASASTRRVTSGSSTSGGA